MKEFLFSVCYPNVGMRMGGSMRKFLVCPIENFILLIQNFGQDRTRICSWPNGVRPLFPIVVRDHSYLLILYFICFRQRALSLPLLYFPVCCIAKFHSHQLSKHSKPSVRLGTNNNLQRIVTGEIQTNTFQSSFKLRNLPTNDKMINR